jgi:hypothetical protein
VAARVLRPLLLVLLSAHALACEGAADKAKDKVKDVAEDVGDKAKDKGKELAGDLKDQANDKAKQLWAERPKTGELSDAAKNIFSKGAEDSDTSVEALLAKGVQLAPVAVDVAKTLHSAIDSDVDIEPIVQKLDDEQGQAELDARIKDMPRVETIDGVDVGFKDVSQWDTGGHESQSAYLILWRRDDRLLGLVYRSRKRVNVDQLVAETPRLIGLVSGAL